MTSKERLEVRVSILRFFTSNPYTMDTAVGISSKVGRPVRVVQIELDRLVQIGILRRRGEGEEAIYQYVKPKVAKESRNA